MQFSRMFRRVWLFSFVTLVGCGSSGHPPLGYVGGKVTYEGAPVANINVLMKPEKGRTAVAVTNKDGKYEIEYTAGAKGTKIGPTVVSLEWPLGTDPPFYVSDKYSAIKSTLKLDVQKGRNKDFDIQIEPDPEGAKKAAAKPKFIVD